MKRRISLTLLGGIFAVSAFAQEANEDEQEVFEMSPFVVETTDNVGYMATNTLAGTRLKTNLDEVGSAISIITTEFMDDTGATDAESLLGYAVNSEVGGALGNFAGGEVTGRANQAGARENPQYNQRIRGLSAAQLTRNFFRTDIPFDRYNVSRITLNRGPNSILFGVGNVAGVVNNTTQQALLENTPVEFRIRVGENGSHRETLEVNRLLIEDRLAVRFNVLRNRDYYDQQPAFRHDGRFYGAATAVLYKGKRGAFLGRTTARMNFETGKIKANPVSTVPPSNAFKDWFSLDHALPTDEQVAAKQAELGRELSDVDVRNLYFELYGVQLEARVNAPWGFSPKSTKEADVGWTGRINLGYPLFRELGVFYQNDGSGTASLGIPGSGLQGGQGSTGNLPDSTFTGSWNSTRSVYAEDWFLGDWTVPVVTDSKVYNNERYLFSGDTNRLYQDFQAKNLVLEQLLWDGKAGVELVVDNQTFSRESFLPFAGGNAAAGSGRQEVFIDINASLNNSTDAEAGRVANPNVGRPVARETYMPTNYSDIERETLRATAYVQFDAKDYVGNKLGFLLGNHTLTGVYSEETRDTRFWSETLSWEGNFPDGSPFTSGAAFSGEGDGESSWSRRFIPIVYVGDSLLGDEYQSASDVRLRPIDFRVPQAGDVYTLFYGDNETGTVREGLFRLKSVPTGGSLAKEVLSSWSGVLHSKFLDDHLISVLGYRYDQQKVYRDIDFDQDDDPSTYNNFFDPEAGTYTGAYNLDQMRLMDQADIEGGNSFSYSVVARFPEEYLFELPFDSDLSVFINYSESFNPVGRRVDVLGNVLLAPKGETEEYGFMLNMLDNKFSIRGNWYETVETGRDLPGGRQNQARGAMDDSVRWIGVWMDRINNAEDDNRPFYDPDAPIDPFDGPPDALRRMYTTFGTDALTGLPTFSVNIPEGVDPRDFRIRDENGNLQPFQVNSYDDMYELIAALHPEPLRSRVNYQFDRTLDRVTSDDSLLDRTSTLDTVAKGFELEVTGNLFRGLRLSANVAHQETTLSNIAPVLRDLADQTWQNLQEFGLANLRDNPTNSDANTYGGRYNRLVRVPLDATQAQEGQITQEQRKWRFNVVANYTIWDRNNPLNGLGFGGAVRWQDKIAVGYPQEAVWANPFDNNAFVGLEEIEMLPDDQASVILGEDPSIIPVLSNPFYDQDTWSGDVWISYRREFKNGIEWRINLNVRNAFGDNDPQVLRRNPDGEVAVIRNAEPTTVTVTNVFRF
jgi:hypothetical protein